MTLDTRQQKFVEELVSGQRHLILTGKAGTGKSTALCAGVKAAQDAGMGVVVMAPTAMAASIHRDAGLDSGTIHHALKWNPVREPLPKRLLAAASLAMLWDAKPDQNRILIVDEASMVGLWLFEVLAREYGSLSDSRPFDGRRLVLVGDWAQLPPVVGSEEQRMARQMPELAVFGPADGCVLYHKMFRMNPPAAIVLEETHRANGDWFVQLNELRECSRLTRLSQFGMSFRSVGRNAETEGVFLCYRRASAHARNIERLERLPGDPVTLLLRDGEMTLKTGCDVLVTSNRAGSGFINGSRAVFNGLDENGSPVLNDGRPIKMLADGNWGRSTNDGGRSNDVDERLAEAGRSRASRMLAQYSELLEDDSRKWLESLLRSDGEYQAARFGSGHTVFQPYFPILAGYAITVHKAQGCTLSDAVLEPDIFWSIAPARLPYVALSRVADGSAITLGGFTMDDTSVRPDDAYPAIYSRICKWSVA